MQVRCKQDEVGCICRPEGNLENLTVPQFRAALAGLPPGSRLVLDLEAVTFVDSAGLGALIGAIRRARENGGDAVVCRPRPSVNRVLQLVGLPRIVYVARDLDEAKSHFLARKTASTERPELNGPN